MTTAAQLRSQLEKLVNDPAVAGISLTGTYDSLTGPTVTPPAGTIRQDGQVVGLFTMADGEVAATLDVWGSVASRCEALLAGTYCGRPLADLIGFPLVTFVDGENNVLATSAELSHRQADATWRLCRSELEAAGVDFEGIQQATRSHPQALVAGFPTAIPFGWWHSQTKRSQAAADKANKEGKSGKKGAGELAQARDELLGYYVMNPADSRSARLFTAEFLAIGVAERRRMAAKVDALFSAVKADRMIGKEKLSTVGLCSIPPTRVVNSTRPDREAPSDLTFRTIESRAFFSFAGLRAFGFEDIGRDGVLSVALTLLLYLLLHENLALRAGTELRLCEPGLEVLIEKQGEKPEELALPGIGELIDLVRELGGEAGWDGPRVVRIEADSPLGRVIGVVDCVAGAEDAGSEA